MEIRDAVVELEEFSAAIAIRSSCLLICGMLSYWMDSSPHFEFRTLLLALVNRSS